MTLSIIPFRLSIDYHNDKYNANLYDWLSWLVPATGFNPGGLTCEKEAAWFDSKTSLHFQQSQEKGMTYVSGGFALNHVNRTSRLGI